MWNWSFLPGKAEKWIKNWPKKIEKEEKDCLSGLTGREGVFSQCLRFPASYYLRKKNFASNFCSPHPPQVKIMYHKKETICIASRTLKNCMRIFKSWNDINWKIQRRGNWPCLLIIAKASFSLSESTIQKKIRSHSWQMTFAFNDTFPCANETHACDFRPRVSKSSRRESRQKI